MRYHRDEFQDEFQGQLPQGLAEDLGAMFGSGFAVPPSRERQILASARAQMLGRNRLRLLRRWGGAAAAIAALVVLAIVLLPQREKAPQQVAQAPRASSVSTPVADARDLNTDGNVNILDAYLLAKRVERMDALDRAMDFNADGEVDRGDADVLAAAAVRIDGGALR